ncbi:MAG: hypothetical protein A2Z64_10200 [Betaproteobacteria bacterium RIFCSPLOWO2_02_67_12]|nr:MAG: hypothetical protein A2Z64_10200 [Betaproteobacteria bacterium RIFCSPLOWO2_02_67_12]
MKAKRTASAPAESSPSNPAAPPASLRVLLSHLASLAVMLGVMLKTGESPRIFVYGLFFNYLYRLLTLRGLAALHDSGSARGRRLARALSRPPHPARPPFPIMVGDGADAKPGGFAAYLFVLAVFAWFTFATINVRDHEIATPLRVIADELLLGLLAGGLWWLLDLADRRITLRFGEPLWTNLGYNSLETTLVAVTVLTGGIASAVMESPWPYFLTLIAFKTWFGVWDETKFPRGEHPPEAKMPGAAKTP